MTDLEHIEALLRENRMDKAHEVHGFPNGWNAGFDWLEIQIAKMRGGKCPHGIEGVGNCSECFDR